MFNYKELNLPGSTEDEQLEHLKKMAQLAKNFGRTSTKVLRDINKRKLNGRD